MKTLQDKRTRIVLISIMLTLIVILVGGSVWASPDDTTADGDIYLPIVFGPEPELPTVSFEPFATGFNTDTISDIVSAGDERLFVVLREGVVKIVMPDGTVLNQPFMDIRNQGVTTENWEQGLLGMTFHPAFPQAPYVYVVYTGLASNRINVIRYTLDGSDPNRIDPNSRYTVMYVHKSLNWAGEPSPVHNGGDLAFGPDGALYISFGDGGPDPISENAPGDPDSSSQDNSTLLGTIVRIDVNQNSPIASQCGGTRDKYTIPGSNPLVGGEGCPEIWASGLRNAWRFSFDRVTGDIYIADVGEEIAEEVNFQPASSTGGENYGWNCYEGVFDYTELKPSYVDHCFGPENYVFPVYEYQNETTCSSVVGGFVYRGSLYPALYGRYLFADFCSGQIKALTPQDDGWQLDIIGEVSFKLTTFGEDANGELYAGQWLAVSGGNTATLYRLVVNE